MVHLVDHTSAKSLAVQVAIATVLMVVVALPQVYRLTNPLLKLVGSSTITVAGEPTLAGVGLHAVVFFGVLYLALWLTNKYASAPCTDKTA